MSAWGTGAWGLGAWGLGVGGAPLSVSECVATSTHTVLVTLAAPPLAISSINPGDALNPATWAVTNPHATFTVLAVQQITQLQYLLTVLEPWDTYLVTHTAACPSLLAPDGTPIMLPTSATFAGVQSQQVPFANAGVVDFDIANPQTPDRGTPGVIPTTPGGDYATAQGAAYAEKLIVRAITTQVGGFYHLPQYGFGLTNGQLVTPSKLSALQANLIAVVEQITVVAAADVAVSFQQVTGITTVTVNAELQNGATIEVVQRVPPPNVQL